MRRLTLIAGLLALMSSVAPVSHAQTGDLISIEFDGEITLWSSPCISDHTSAFCSSPSSWAEPRELWAATSPNPTCDPLCPQAPGKYLFWALGEENSPDSGVPCTAVTGSGVRPCWVRGVGAMSLVSSVIPGPYCYSVFQGSVNYFDITIDGRTTTLVGVPAGVLHSWPVMRWSLTDTNGPNTVDGGAGAMIIQNPRGNCGLDPIDGFAPMREADVTGGLAWTHAANF